MISFSQIQEIIILIGGFAIVAIAANQISRVVHKFHLPLITGLLFTGIISGPFVFNLIPVEAKYNLGFISDIALAYIAFAAGSELYLKELRGRIKSIKWITFSQLVITFLMSAAAIYFFKNRIPFLNQLTEEQGIIVALMSGVIFIARSPASAIAIISEMRAKGPFTQTVMGVTVLKDFIVVILFAVCLSISMAINSGEAVKIGGILIVILEIVVSFGLGFVLTGILKLILSTHWNSTIKRYLILFSGYSIYILYNVTKFYSLQWFGKEFLIEPLLTCILGSFLITNYSKYRYEFIKIVKDLGSLVYVAFFTLAGAVLSLDVISTFWMSTLIFFFIRLISIIIGTYVGSTLAGDPPLYHRIGWMPFITQAGVALGLSIIVARSFPSWGFEFATIITSMIVVNEIIGPPLFKWALNIVGEGHKRAGTPGFDGVKDAIIFGWESQSVALARQLMENGWEVKIATFNQDIDTSEYSDCTIVKIDSIDLPMLEMLKARQAEAAVLMLQDEENLKICQLLYEHIGTKDVIVRLNHRYNFKKFHDLKALVVDPSTAIVSLMDHFVRSPQAASLLLGLEENQDTIDLEMMNPNLHGIPLRDIRFPSDIIILSIKRGGHLLITHGYTRLRMGDVVTMVGSKEGLKNLALKFEG